MLLNLYIARAGIASRRKAAEFIKQGFVSVNDKQETNPAYQVQPQDIVRYDGKLVKIESEYSYILLYKPVGFMSTTSDEHARDTVLDLVPKVKGSRLYPVGRLDNQTEGLILLTNDGDLAHTLAHPSFNISKTYEVILEIPISTEQLIQLKKGLSFKDGFTKPDYAGFVGKSRRVLKITLHSGKKHIIRRMIHRIGSYVKKLTRVKLADLNLRGLKPGMWRKLSNDEVLKLKELASKTQKPKSKSKGLHEKHI